MATYNVTLNIPAFGDEELISDTDYILWNMNAKLFPRRLPAVVFVGLLAIIGSVGNGLVICVYRKHLQKSTVNVFIFWLGLVDFSLCFFQMPYKVFDISFPLMYGYPILCKGFGFIEIFLSMISIILLLCIAFDRYFVVRRPLKRLTMENINCLITVCIVLGLLFSWPTVVVYGEQRMKTSVPGVYSWGCGVAKEMMGSKVVPFWYYFLYAVFIVTCITLVTVYVRIWQSIRKWKYTTIGESMSTPLRKPQSSAAFSRGATLFHKALPSIAPGLRFKLGPAKDQGASFHSPLNPVSDTSEQSEKDEKVVDVQSKRTSVAIPPDDPPGEDEPSESSSEGRSSGTTSTAKTAESCELGKLVNPPEPQSTTRSVKHARMRRNTLIFGSIAAVFVVSYLPILTIIFLRTTGVYNLKDAPLWQAQLAEVCHRSGYINNAVNPFIYGFLSPWFRLQVKNIFIRSV